MKKIVETGVNVIVSGGKVADLALHFANKYKVMVVRLNSKWDLRRLCKTVNATALPRLVSRYSSHLLQKVVLHDLSGDWIFRSEGMLDCWGLNVCSF